MLKTLYQWIHDSAGISPAIQQKIFISLLIIIIILTIRRFLLYLLKKTRRESEDIFRFSKYLSYFGSFLIFLFLGNIWMRDFDVGTFLGILGAGLAIAFKDPLVNFVAWIYLIFRKTISIGDRIEIGDVAGDVINIDPFDITLMEISNRIRAEQSTGRMVHIPNGKVFSEKYTLYNRGFTHIWDEIPVLLTFESNWKKGKIVFEEILAKYTEKFGTPSLEDLLEKQEKYMIHYSKISPIVYTSVLDSGVELTLRFLSEPRRCRSGEEFIWEAILEAIAANEDLNLAYPTYRIVKE